MNPRQRRGALLLIVAGVLALGMVFALSSYVADVQSQLGPTATQLRVTQDVPFLEPLDGTVIEVVEVPQRYLSEAALTDSAQVLGQVAAYDLQQGTVLQAGAVMDAPQIESGEREVAVLLDPETGVGGKIRPGDVVDVYATFAAQQSPDPQGRPIPATARVVLEGVRIIDIAPAVTDAAAEFAGDRAVPVTFALTTQEALEIAYVESFAIEIRLGLRVATDTAPLEAGARVYQGEAGE